MGFEHGGSKTSGFCCCMHVEVGEVVPWPVGGCCEMMTPHRVLGRVGRRHELKIGSEEERKKDRPRGDA